MLIWAMGGEHGQSGREELCRSRGLLPFLLLEGSDQREVTSSDLPGPVAMEVRETSKDI